MGHLGAGGHCRFSAQFKHGGGWPDLDLATSTGDGAIYEALGTAEPDEDPRGRRSPPMEPDSWIREKARQLGKKALLLQGRVVFARESGSRTRVARLLRSLLVASQGRSRSKVVDELGETSLVRDASCVDEPARRLNSVRRPNTPEC